MQQANENLETLQQRLSLAYLRKAELDQEIQTLSPTGIHSLPYELLCNIFEKLEPFGSVSLENIRLVCRLWNEAVENIPCLWSNICITVPSTLQSADRCNEHCIRHLERSKQNLLDITINFLSYPSQREFLEQLLAISILTNSSSAIQQWFMDGIVIGRDWPSWRPDMHYLHCGHSSFEALIKECEFRRLRPLSTLVGTNDEVMSRWRSFDLTHSHYSSQPHDYQPHDYYLKEIFPEGIKIYPSCESFRLHCIYGVWEIPIILVNHRRQKLRSLELRNVIPQQLDMSAIDPLRLLHLSLNRLNTDSLRFILQCQNLEHLGVQYSDERIIQDPQVQLTTFLNLRILETHGVLPPYLFRFISVPFLQTLIIHEWNLGAIPLQSDLKNLLPSLNRVEFRMAYYPNTYYLDILGFVFIHAPLVDTVMIGDTELDDFLGAVSKLDDEGIRPGNLKHLIITKRWEDGQKQATILRSIEYPRIR